MSRHQEDPSHAVKPFQPNSDGHVHGEGAAALVLESHASVKKRNANTIAKLTGWSRGFGNFRSPNFADTIVSVAEAALNMAGLSAQDLSHINACGLATPWADNVEALAISRLSPHSEILALKSVLGHAGPSSAVIETVASLLAMTHHSYPLSLMTNVSYRDGLRPATEYPNDRSAFLKLAFSPEGQIAALVFDAA
ncbi:MAG: hypothetical protein R3C03_01110 [Pirellulaceae bacterium]